LEGAGGREPQAQEASCRAGDGQRDAEGDAGKKLLTPAARRSAVRRAIEEKEYSQRRGCSLVGLAPKVYRRRSRRGDDGVLRTRNDCQHAETPPIGKSVGDEVERPALIASKSRHAGEREPSSATIWTGAHGAGDAALAAGDERSLALHCAGQADPERVRRELHRSAA